MKKNNIISVISILLTCGLLCSCNSSLKMKPSLSSNQTSKNIDNEYPCTSTNSAGQIVNSSCPKEPVNSNNICTSTTSDGKVVESSCPVVSQDKESENSTTTSQIKDSQSNASNNNQTSHEPSNSTTKPPKPPINPPKPPPPSNDKTWDKGGNYTGSINIKGTSSPKKDVMKKSGAMLDLSNKSGGYVTASVTATKKVKLQVKFGNNTYNYDLKNNGTEEVFPLQFGNGNYTFRFMRNTTGNKYTPIASFSFDVSLNSQFEPFLVPSQYVNYNSSSTAVRKSFGLSMNAKSDLEKTRSIYNYIIENISYDTPKAQSVQSGYLPNVDSTYSSRKGICFDYAALMAAMLRAQGVPTKLVIGTVAPNGIAHAWNSVYIKGKGWIAIGIDSNGNQWKRLDATFGTAKNQESIAQFIGNGSNYVQLRYY